MTSAAEGSAAVRLARAALETCLRRSEEEDPAVTMQAEQSGLPPLFNEKRGLFVTLLTHPGKDLRGCIGFTEPIYRLRDGIPRAAVYAAREDPRFPPVEPEDLPALLVEVSLLTPPEPVVVRRPDELPGQIRIGRDGLIVSEEGCKGVLLPQVPVEEGWDAETFLSHTCLKAGLSPAAWRRAGPKFWRFRSDIFLERTPRGAVVELPIAPAPPRVP
jgi:uncharacterized protein